jgi:hypothetical protein
LQTKKIGEGLRVICLGRSFISQVLLLTLPFYSFRSMTELGTLRPSSIRL